MSGLDLDLAVIKGDMALVKQVLDDQLDDFRLFGQHIERYLSQVS